MCERQPMDTAPTDGTYVLLLIEPDEFEGGHPYWMEGFHSLRAWRTKEHVGAEPLAWAPLPSENSAKDEK